MIKTKHSGNIVFQKLCLHSYVAGKGGGGNPAQWGALNRANVANQ